MSPQYPRRLLQRAIRGRYGTGLVAFALLVIAVFTVINNEDVRTASPTRTPCSICLWWLAEQGPLPSSSMRRQLQLVPTHVMLAGHSRLRQLYQTLAGRLQLVSRRRIDPAPPLPDSDADGLLAPNVNSTCLAAFRPPQQPDSWWCSQAADRHATRLQLRWRNSGQQLWQLLDQLARAEDDSLPDQLVLTYGVYFLILPSGSREPWRQLEQLRQDLATVTGLLNRLQHRGVRVLWVLEHAVNSERQFSDSTMQYRLEVINTMVHEALLWARVPVWTAHLPLATHLFNRICRSRQPVSNDTQKTCKEEFFHLDQNTVHLVSDQLWRYLSTGI